MRCLLPWLLLACLCGSGAHAQSERQPLREAGPQPEPPPRSETIPRDPTGAPTQTLPDPTGAPGGPPAAVPNLVRHPSAPTPANEVNNPAPAGTRRPPGPSHRDAEPVRPPPPVPTDDARRPPSVSPPPRPALPAPALPVVTASAAEDIEPGELLFFHETLALAQQQQALLQADGLRLLRRRVLGAVGGVLSTYRAPDDERFQRWRTLAAGGEANHRYQPLDDQDSPARRSRDMVGWPPAPAASGCGQGLRIGLIDGPIFLQHPLLLGSRIEAASLLPQGVPPASMRHGTGVASVLVGQRDTPGLLPGAQLIALVVMRARGDLVDTTAEWLIQAVDRLVGARVGVINLSLGGPANRWLGEVLERARAKGVVLVAAAGNGGPDSAVVFPASHPAVLAVTSVDLASRIDPHAPRGDAIALAAPGVDVPVAADDGGVVYRSGSSYAAPFVSAALAAGADPRALQRGARDLGIPGRDPVYGWGLLQAEHPCHTNR